MKSENSIEKEHVPNSVLWETPEQYLKRTGGLWPGNAAVWARKRSSITDKWGFWQLSVLKNIQKLYEETGCEFFQIVVLNGSNFPPDDWSPKD
jgi:hypothetical protein